MKHTQGNWQKHEAKKSIIVNSQDLIEQTIICQIYGSGEEAEANANLITSSPELLEVAKYAYAMLHQDPNTQFAPLVESLRKAIKKAKGE